jgi:methionine-rich copper-binding protein CopC
MIIQNKAIRILTACAAFIALTVSMPLSHTNAHSAVVSQSPKANQTLKASPATVKLVLSEDLISSGAAVVVRSSQGQTVSVGKTKVSRRDLSIALQPKLPNGTYQVAYRVVSNDGHVITSSFKFRVQAPLP